LRLGTRRAILGYQLGDPDYCRRQQVLSSASDTVHTQKMTGPGTWNGDEMKAITVSPAAEDLAPPRVQLICGWALGKLLIQVSPDWLVRFRGLMTRLPPLMD
jgi:hypothetical protein